MTDLTIFFFREDCRRTLELLPRKTSLSVEGSMGCSAAAWKVSVERKADKGGLAHEVSERNKDFTRFV